MLTLFATISQTLYRPETYNSQAVKVFTRIFDQLGIILIVHGSTNNPIQLFGFRFVLATTDISIQLADTLLIGLISEPGPVFRQMVSK